MNLDLFLPERKPTYLKSIGYRQESVKIEFQSKHIWDLSLLDISSWEENWYLNIDDFMLVTSLR